MRDAWGRRHPASRISHPARFWSRISFRVASTRSRGCSWRARPTRLRRSVKPAPPAGPTSRGRFSAHPLALPPVGGAPGPRGARRGPLVEEVVITAHPGQELVPWPEGARYPGFIFARGGTPDAVEAALRAAHARLHFVLTS